MIEGYGFDYVSYKMGAEFAYKVEELEKERDELLKKVNKVNSMLLVNLYEVYNELCTVKNRDGTRRTIPDYDVDNFANTIDIKDIKRILHQIKIIKLED